MSERIDHVTEATTYLSPEWASAENVQKAQVHATLALVEQQRISNLVQLLASAKDGVARGIHSSKDFMEMYEKLNPEIKKGLGID